jgi:hypothetical protein
MAIQKISILLLSLLMITLISSCTWRQAATLTANAAVYTAMIATGNAGEWDMNAYHAGELAEGVVDLAFDGANCTDE